MNLTIVFTLVSALIMSSALYDTYFMWLDFMNSVGELTYEKLDKVAIIEITPRTVIRVVSNYVLSIILYPAVSLFCGIVLHNPAAILAAIFVAVVSFYSAVAGLMMLYNLNRYRHSTDYAARIRNMRITKGDMLTDFGLSTLCTLCIFYTVYCLFIIPTVV